jgi:exosortase
MSTTTEHQVSLRRWVFLAIWLGITVILYAHPLRSWLSLSLSDEDASHLPIIPLMAAVVVYLERGTIFREVTTDLVIPGGLAASSLAVTAIVTWTGQAWLPVNRLSGYMLSLVLLWIAGFVAAFGRKAARRAIFPLLLLVLMAPFPQFLLDRMIYLLQKGSAEVASFLFEMSGVPVLREGFTFYFAHVSIEVARECSGIRSSLALLLLALLIVHFRLETPWKKIVFIAAGMLVMIVKNGVRIATLTLLASYVDPGFLYGRLHREGGVVFFLLGLLLLVPVLWWLERSEPRARPAHVAAQD